MSAKTSTYRHNLKINLGSLLHMRQKYAAPRSFKLLSKNICNRYLSEIVRLLANAVVHKVDEAVSDVATRCRVLHQE